MLVVAFPEAELLPHIVVGHLGRSIPDFSATAVLPELLVNRLEASQLVVVAAMPPAAGTAPRLRHPLC